MLDLDQLAEKQAQFLAQNQEDWRLAVWSNDFQKLSQSMTDGEVETFISVCSSVLNFETLVKYVKQQCEKSAETSPFTVLKSSAAACGLSIEDWARDLSVTAK